MPNFALESQGNSFFFFLSLVMFFEDFHYNFFTITSSNVFDVFIAGATILHNLSTETYPTQSPELTVLGIILKYPPINPRKVIQGNPLIPGQCWPFKGSKGHIFISLSHHITITHVTLGHISKFQHPTGFPTSAPRTFSVYVSHKFATTSMEPLFFTSKHIADKKTRCSIFCFCLSGTQNSRRGRNPSRNI